MRRFVFALIALAAVIVSSGCASPSQRYRTAVDLYTGTMRTATVALENGYINESEADAIESLRIVARERLAVARSKLETDPQDPTVAGVLREVRAIIAQIRALAAPAIPPAPGGGPEPLPVP